MIDPKEFELDNKIYILSKFTASAGRDIIIQYGASAIPKLGNYDTNRKMADKMLSFVAVRLENGNEIRLSSEALIDNHIKDWESRMKIEWAMMEYNCSVFQDGRISSFFGDFAQNLNQWISSTLTSSLEQLWQKIKQPSTNSEPSTV